MGHLVDETTQVTGFIRATDRCWVQVPDQTVQGSLELHLSGQNTGSKQGWGLRAGNETSGVLHAGSYVVNSGINSPVKPNALHGGTVHAC